MVQGEGGCVKTSGPQGPASPGPGPLWAAGRRSALGQDRLKAQREGDPRGDELQGGAPAMGSPASWVTAWPQALSPSSCPVPPRLPAGGPCPLHGPAPRQPSDCVLLRVPWQDGTALRAGPKCRVYSVGRRRFLQLSHCSLDDAGEYTCDAGDCRASATLRVYGTTGQPRGLPGGGGQWGGG